MFTHCFNLTRYTALTEREQSTLKLIECTDAVRVAVAAHNRVFVDLSQSADRTPVAVGAADKFVKLYVSTMCATQSL